MQTPTKPSVPTSPIPARSSQPQPGQAPTVPQPLPDELLQHVSGAGPNRGW